MAKKPPAFQFYVNDWLSSSSVAMMTPEQRGCYIQLLARAWPDGIPYDAHASSMLWALASMPSADAWDKIKGPVLAQFVERDGRLINLKLEEQFKSMASYHTMAEARAKKAAEARWGKSGEQTDASSMPQAMLGHASSTVSSSASSTVENGTVRYSAVPALQVKREEQKNTETTHEIEIEWLKKDWSKHFPDLTFNPDDMRNLLAIYSIDDIAGVMMWLRHFHVGKGSFNWRDKIHSTADFDRCFGDPSKGMFKQYIACGGLKVAETAQTKFERDLEQMKKKTFTFAVEKCSGCGEPVHFGECKPEVFAVDDVKDTDGLVEDIPYK